MSSHPHVHHSDEHSPSRCDACGCHRRRNLRARWAAVGAAIAVIAGTGGIAYSGATNAQITPSQTLITPCRIMDTRPAPNTIGPRNTAIAGGETYTIQVTGSNGNCTIPPGTSGVVMNVTVAGPAANGYLTVFPGGATRPNASNINYSAGQAPVGDSGVTVALGPTGQVSFYASGGPVNVIADVVGYTTAARLTSAQLSLDRWDQDRAKPEEISFGYKTNPTAVIFDGSKIWAPNSETAGGRVAQIDTSTNALSNLTSIGGLPSGVGFDGTILWVTQSGSNAVTRVNATTGAVVGSAITVGSSPSSAAFDGTYVWIANSGSNNITRINAATGVVNGAAIAVGASPTDIIFDGTFMWVANYNGNTVTRINAATLATTTISGVGTNPVALAFDGTEVWVASPGSNNVTRINAASGSVVGPPITTGAGPRALAFDGEIIWVANATAQSITRIDTNTKAVVGAAIPTVSGPTDIAFDGTNMWVSETSFGLSGGNVTKIRAR